jgi:hypothetical protein
MAAQNAANTLPIGLRSWQVCERFRLVLKADVRVLHGHSYVGVAGQFFGLHERSTIPK